MSPILNFGYSGTLEIKSLILNVFGEAGLLFACLVCHVYVIVFIWDKIIEFTIQYPSRVFFDDCNV
jgi:hypothetical protein